jgi:hypothetical protein
MGFGFEFVTTNKTNIQWQVGGLRYVRVGILRMLATIHKNLNYDMVLNWESYTVKLLQITLWNPTEIINF